MGVDSLAADGLRRAGDVSVGDFAHDAFLQPAVVDLLLSDWSDQDEVAATDARSTRSAADDDGGSVDSWPDDLDLLHLSTGRGRSIGAVRLSWRDS